MSIIRKVWQGDRERYPRWRDEKGNFVGSRRLFKNGSRAIISGVARIAFGLRPELPWISYDAIEMLSKHLRSNSRVLEFGSGMSTVWYAKHAGNVVSVEDNLDWFKSISEVFKKNQIACVDYSLADNEADYVSAGIRAGGLFDLIMVDGSYRSECIKTSLHLLAKGGIIYLDNSDKHSSSSGGDTRIAECVLLDFAKSNDCAVIRYSDFAPTQLFAQEGLCIKRGQ